MTWREQWREQQRQWQQHQQQQRHKRLDEAADHLHAFCTALLATSLITEPELAALLEQQRDWYAADAAAFVLVDGDPDPWEV